MDSSKPIPDFDDLPAVDGMPQGCAWGIFDAPGKRDDVFGTLNLLTPDVVRSAAKEVHEGVSISLNWPLNGIKFDIPGRKRPEHNVIWLPDTLGLKGWDDELSFNTQMSSQWDSLCHMHHQETDLAYNGAKCTKEELNASESGKLPTIDRWHDRGGLVGRGVLIDFKRYADEKGIVGADGQAFHPFSGYRITVEEIEAVAKHQGVDFHHGDILIVRTGATEVLANPTQEDFAMLMKATLSGVHGTKETAKWVWNKHFAAVAGDSQSFEAYPPLKEDGGVGESKDLDGVLTSDAVLHQYFLAMFGLPIGELWDLKQLSEHCLRAGKYSFMLTSAPLNHPGLVASPPNALAIF